MASELDIQSFAETQIALLQAELKAELAESSTQTSTLPPAALQRAGAAIVNLTIASTRTGLGGKTVFELEPDPATSSSTALGTTSDGSLRLPEHGIRVGDVVSVQTMISGSAKKKEKADAETAGCSGVVSKVGEAKISVALDKDEVDVPQGRLWIVKLANDITYKRMTQTMKTLQSLPSNQNTTLIRILFGHSKPHLKAQSEIDNFAFKPVNISLDASQLSAIKFALSSPDIALIHGPPGTGKTTTLVEIILQLALNQNKRVLVCAASNIAVDNLVERLSHHPVPIVRLGHPARVLPQVISHSLDALSKSSDAGEIVRDVRKELDDKTAELMLPRKKGGKKEDRRGKWSEVRELRKDYRERERRAVEEVVKGSKVVLATLHGAGGRDLKGEKFDILIVDEASQALEAQIWVALLGTGSSFSSIEKLILAGDHLQLPPTIKSMNSSNTSSKSKSKEKTETTGASLETTLFDRLLKLHGSGVKRMLTTQYRMHASIMAFPSAELYDSKLVCGPGVEARLLTDLPYEIADTEDTKEPLVFWDTQGGDFPELVSTAEEAAASKDSKSIRNTLADSKSNPSEALLVRHHVRNLVPAGVKPEDVAVITPYNAQLSILGGLMKEEFPTMEMGSVDGFQGREKEAVIVSLVRSGEGDVGFLAESRRLNVSMTRPKRHLCVIGDSGTLSKGTGFLKRWMAHLEENADLRYPNVTELEAES